MTSILISVAKLFALAAATFLTNCAATDAHVVKATLDTKTTACVRATIADLWNDPSPYAGKRLCVSGFLGRMVRYGEDSADLFETKEDAGPRHSEHYVTISLPLTIAAQEELSGYALRKLIVVGTFEFDARCWPKAKESKSRYQCFPSRPMQLLKPEIAFGDNQN